jgi:hypothetical protein
MKKDWKEQLNQGHHQEDWREEWHRIDVSIFPRSGSWLWWLISGQVDCRRTDRTQSIYAVPANVIKKGEEEKEAGGAGSGWDGVGEEEEGGMAGLNSKWYPGFATSLL